MNQMDVLFVTAATPTERLYAKYSYPWQRLAVGTGRLGLKVAVCAPAWMLSPTRVVNWLKSCPP